MIDRSHPETTYGGRYIGKYLRLEICMALLGQKTCNNL